MTTANLTVERLRRLLEYDADTGIFIWLVRRSKDAVPGATAGSVNKDGYIQIGIDGALYYAHRLALFYMHGAWPVDLVDHKNRVRTDNRIVNLRSAPLPGAV